DEELHEFGDRRHRADHRPCDFGRAALWDKRELQPVVRLEGPDEVEIERNFVRQAFRDLHPALPDLCVAFPGVRCTLAARRAAKIPFHARVHPFPRRPLPPTVEIREQSLNLLRRRLDGGRAGDAENVGPAVGGNSAPADERGEQHEGNGEWSHGSHQNANEAVTCPKSSGFGWVSNSLLRRTKVKPKRAFPITNAPPSCRSAPKGLRLTPGPSAAG